MIVVKGYKEEMTCLGRRSGTSSTTVLNLLVLVLGVSSRITYAMVQFSLLAAVSLIPGMLAAPGEILPSRNAQKETSNEIVTRQGGYYFQNWSENGSNIRCNNGAGASYTASWNSKGGFVCGKGYNVGGSR